MAQMKTLPGATKPVGNITAPGKISSLMPGRKPGGVSNLMPGAKSATGSLAETLKQRQDAAVNKQASVGKVTAYKKALNKFAGKA